MSSIYIPYVVSILTDYFMTRSGDSFIEMTHLMKHIQTIRRMEVPPWFFLTRDRSSDVPKEQWGNGYETPDGIHSETIRNVMNFTPKAHFVIKITVYVCFCSSSRAFL
jgi:hypothetical protein